MTFIKNRYWIVPANPGIYDIKNSLKNGYVDWRDSNRNYEVGDYVFFYLTKPYQSIGYKCLVTEIKIPFDKVIEDKQYWHKKNELDKASHQTFIRLKKLQEYDIEKLKLDSLLNNGLKTAPQGPIIVKPHLLKYIEQTVNNVEEKIIEEKFLEGKEFILTQGGYSRSKKAREACINYHGVDCYFCGFNFEQVYGSIGRGFIHVHHLTPLSNIKNEYIVNPLTDMIPVCPNCHAMLHVKKQDGSDVTTKELEKIFSKKFID